MSNRIAKITNKELLGKINPLDLIGKGPFCIIAGQALAVKTFKTTYGDSVGLAGAFSAINRITGEVVESAMVFVSEDIALAAKHRLDAGEIIVDVQCTVEVIKTDKNLHGYAWIYAPVIGNEVMQKQAEVTTKMLAASANMPQLVLGAPKTASKGK